MNGSHTSCKFLPFSFEKNCRSLVQFFPLHCRLEQFLKQNTVYFHELFSFFRCNRLTELNLANTSITNYSVNYLLNRILLKFSLLSNCRVELSMIFLVFLCIIFGFLRGRKQTRGASSEHV